MARVFGSKHVGSLRGERRVDQGLKASGALRSIATKQLIRGPRGSPSLGGPGRGERDRAVTTSSSARSTTRQAATGRAVAMSARQRPQLPHSRDCPARPPALCPESSSTRLLRHLNGARDAINLIIEKSVGSPEVFKQCHHTGSGSCPAADGPTALTKNTRPWLIPKTRIRSQL